MYIMYESISAKMYMYIFLVKNIITLLKKVGMVLHYEKAPMQHTAIFHGCTNDNFRLKFFYYFYIFAQNIDCGYTLEMPHWGSSNEYTQSMF